MVANIRKKEKTVGRSTIYKFLSLSLTVVVCAIIIYQGSNLKNELQKVDFVWAGAGLGCYFINYLLRALRIRTISKGRICYWPAAVYSACLHGFASYILPVRSGDLTLPVILNKVSGMSLLEGGRLLVKARLLDISMLGFWVVCAVLFTSINIELSVRVAWLIMGIVFCMAPTIIKWIASFGENRTQGILKRIAGFGNVGFFTTQEIIQSLAIWAAVGSCFYCTVKAVGLSLGIGEVWLLISINLPLQLIPIQGFANTGNHEGGWVAALALLGISAREGLRFALTSHALLLSYVLALWPLVAIGQIVNMKKR